MINIKTFISVSILAFLVSGCLAKKDDFVYGDWFPTDYISKNGNKVLTNSPWEFDKNGDITWLGCHGKLQQTNFHTYIAKFVHPLPFLNAMTSTRNRTSVNFFLIRSHLGRRLEVFSIFRGTQTLLINLRQMHKANPTAQSAPDDSRTLGSPVHESPRLDASVPLAFKPRIPSKFKFYFSYSAKINPEKLTKITWAYQMDIAKFSAKDYLVKLTGHLTNQRGLYLEASSQIGEAYRESALQFVSKLSQLARGNIRLIVDRNSLIKSMAYSGPDENKDYSYATAEEFFTPLPSRPLSPGEGWLFPKYSHNSVCFSRYLGVKELGTTSCNHIITVLINSNDTKYWVSDVFCSRRTGVIVEETLTKYRIILKGYPLQTERFAIRRANAF